jgi:hypothetical protein
MIQDANGQPAPEEALLRLLALNALKRWARAASKDTDILADVLGATDTPARRKTLAKIFENLGRTSA